MSNRNQHWIVRIGEKYLKHPSGPQVTGDPEKAYGCHYKSTAQDYLKEFSYLHNPSRDATSVVIRRCHATKL